MKLLPPLLALMSLFATNSSAGGINLTWGEGCWADNPATMQTFACDNNSGSFSLTASFVPTSRQAISTLTAQLDLQSDSPLLPDWWQMCDPGACRAGALSATAVFATGACSYAWTGLPPQAAVNWQTRQWCGDGSIPSNRAQLIGYFGGHSSVVLQPGTEYYAFRLTISTQKSNGMDACGGCSVPATLVLNEIALYGTGLDQLTAPLSNTCLRWQAAGTTPCSATPVRRTTWGTIKSLYR